MKRKHLGIIKAAAPALRRFPVRPGFEGRVLQRYRAYKKETVWKSLDNVPRPLLRGAFALSILILILLVFAGEPLPPTNGEMASSQGYLVDPSVNLNEPSLQTDEQALQFALFDGFDLTEGELP